MLSPSRIPEMAFDTLSNRISTTWTRKPQRGKSEGWLGAFPYIRIPGDLGEIPPCRKAWIFRRDRRVVPHMLHFPPAMHPAFLRPKSSARPSSRTSFDKRQNWCAFGWSVDKLKGKGEREGFFWHVKVVCVRFFGGCYFLWLFLCWLVGSNQIIALRGKYVSVTAGLFFL